MFLGINLFALVAHEIGHSLGLKHTSVPGAVMANGYVHNWKHLKLHQDDIQGLQTLYGQTSVELIIIIFLKL